MYFYLVHMLVSYLFCLLRHLFLAFDLSLFIFAIFFLFTVVLFSSKGSILHLKRVLSLYGTQKQQWRQVATSPTLNL